MSEAKKVEVKAPKVEKPKIMSLVSRFKRIGATGVKSRKELAKLAFEECQKANQLINVRGKRITQEKVERHVSNFIRDIVNKRKGHWETLEVTEDEKSLKIAPKIIA